MITREQLIKSYTGFFKSKNHKIIPSASLVPENDPTVLFTTAGMHPLVPYILGQKHSQGSRLVNVQKCLRTGDIDQVGDKVHHTFFEMLGNWSLGDYWKKESIEYSFEFLTKTLKIPKEKLAVTCFTGDKDAPRDTQSALAWQSLGIPQERIAFLGKEDNWWGPAGQVGPCGPDTEIFYWSSNKKAPRVFNSEDKGWIEIWNNVFMEYEKTKVKAILVDAIECLINKDKKLNGELAEVLHQYNLKIIVATNAEKEEIKSILNNYGFHVFTLNKSPSKEKPEYFKKLLDEYNLDPKEVIYFDHKKENIISANKAGILKAELYKDNKKIKEFINDNLYVFISLKQRNVDTGMGVERTLAALNNLEDNYETPSFIPLIEAIEEISDKDYQDYKKEMRIIADHIRASVFLVADGVIPSNVERGYVLRRLLRRAIVYSRKISIPLEKSLTKTLAETCIGAYPDYDLDKKRRLIENVLSEEENKFEKTLALGIKEFDKLSKNSSKIEGKDAFLLFQSYGFPIEMTLELAKERDIKVDVEEFSQEYKKHQELSKSLSSGMFKSGLADDSEQTTKLHTATHLLNEALRRVFGPEVKQRGSNITPERLRFDFNFPRKLTEEEIIKIENLVNEKISKNLKVVREELSYKEAVKQGAQAEFGHKYPERVSVYTIQDASEKHKWFSREICTGPHVSNTSQIGHFKIIKEESVAAGIRRIKAILE